MENSNKKKNLNLNHWEGYNSDWSSKPSQQVYDWKETNFHQFDHEQVQFEIRVERSKLFLKKISETIKKKAETLNRGNSKKKT